MAGRGMLPAGGARRAGGQGSTGYPGAQGHAGGRARTGLPRYPMGLPSLLSPNTGLLALNWPI